MAAGKHLAHRTGRRLFMLDVLQHASTSFFAIPSNTIRTLCICYFSFFLLFFPFLLLSFCNSRCIFLSVSLPSSSFQHSNRVDLFVPNFCSSHYLCHVRLELVPAYRSCVSPKMFPNTSSALYLTCALSLDKKIEWLMAEVIWIHTLLKWRGRKAARIDVSTNAFPSNDN